MNISCRWNGDWGYFFLGLALSLSGGRIASYGAPLGTEDPPVAQEPAQSSDPESEAERNRLAAVAEKCVETALIRAGQGRLPDARELLNEAFEIRSQLFGPAFHETVDAKEELDLVESVLAADQTKRTQFATLRRLEREYQQAHSYGKVSIAIKTAEAGEALAKELFGDSAEASRWLCRRGGLEININHDVDLAFALLSEALAMEGKCLPAKHQWRGTTLSYFANVLEERGELEAAQDRRREALEHFRDSADPDAALMLKGMAETYIKQERRDEAESTFLAALTWVEESASKRLDDDVKMYLVRANVHLAEFYADDFAKAEPYHLEGIRLGRSCGPTKSGRLVAIFELKKLAMLYRKHGRFGDAGKAYDDLEPELELIDPSIGCAEIQLEMATFYLDVEDLRRAERCHESALAVIRRIGFERMSGRSDLFFLLAVSQLRTYQQGGKPQQALENLDSFLADERVIPNANAVADAHLCILVSAALQDLGELDRSRTYVTTAIRVAHEKGQDELSFLAQRQLARIEQSQGKTDKAVEALTAAIESGCKAWHEQHPMVAACQGDLAKLYLDHGDLPAGTPLAVAAIESLRSAGCEPFPVCKRLQSVLEAVQHVADQPSESDTRRR